MALLCVNTCTKENKLTVRAQKFPCWPPDLCFRVLVRTVILQNKKDRLFLFQNIKEDIGLKNNISRRVDKALKQCINNPKKIKTIQLPFLSSNV